jgi:hypothetical protein
MSRVRSLLSPSRLALMTAVCGVALAAPAVAAPPPDQHPRMWVRKQDLPELMKRASAQNPIYEEGLKKVAADAIKKMDDPAPGDILSMDNGSWAESYTECSELYSQVLAFMYLLAPDGSAEKADYGKRAKKLVMNVIDNVYSGLQKMPQGTTLGDMAPGGAKYYNEKWWGGRFALDLRTFIEDAIPLTIDWIYPLLTADDKAKVRTVFLYWSKLVTEKAATTGDHDRPKPPGVYNDPQLLDLGDYRRVAARFGLNNWFAMHMRLLGYMALSLDAADDVPHASAPKGSTFFNELTGAKAGSLRDYLKAATGAYLYMIDYGEQNDARGGLSPEGMQYTVAGLGPTAQLHLALKTSGWDDPNLYPQRQDQVTLTGKAFWKDLFPAYASQLTPVPVIASTFEWYGPVYQAAWYGDGERHLVGEQVFLFGALARYHDLAGNKDQADMARWFAIHVSPGSTKELVRRVRTALTSSSSRAALLYFLGVDGAAKSPEDPRPKMPLAWHAPGLNSVSARTSWDKDARWMSYMLPWTRVDHQHGEGNMIQLFRKGEWLTKKWVAYGPRAACSDFSNTLTVLNDPSDKYNQAGTWQNEQWLAGSQWQYIGAGDPLLVGWSDAADYTYSYGDATNLYNSKMDNALAVGHVSRSLVWLKPDHLVVYDRAATKKPDRFKRFWLNFENAPKIQGSLVTGTTKGGQQLFLRTLLPEKATYGVESDHPMWKGGGKQTASGEIMAHRLKVEAPNQPEVRFLHVLQGADAGAAADATTRVRGTSGTAFDGAIVKDTVVMFPQDFGEPAAALGYEVPEWVKRHVVTGLAADKGYSVAVKVAGDKVAVSIQPGGEVKSDKGGVLTFGPDGKARPLGATAQGGAASLQAIQAAAAGLPPPGTYSTPEVPPPGTDSGPGPAVVPAASGAPAPSPTAPGTTAPRGCGCGTNAGGASLPATLSLGALAGVLRRRRRKR